MLRSPTRPEAVFRGVAVGVVTFAAGLTAHAFAMRSMSSAPMSESGSPSTTGHDMASMTGHAMPMAGHDMASMHVMHAAHGMAPVTPAAPSIPSLSMLLLAAVCALLALVASRPRAAGPAATGGMLLLGQGVGHLALGLTMGHLAMSPAMAGAHAAAALVAGVVIAGAEHALRVALGVLEPLAATGRSRPRTVVAPVWTFRRAPIPVLARHGALRAPPC